MVLVPSASVESDKVLPSFATIIIPEISGSRKISCSPNGCYKTETPAGGACREVPEEILAAVLRSSFGPMTNLKWCYCITTIPV